MAKIKCPSCSAEADDTMLFCPNCFNEFDKPAASSSGGASSASSDSSSGEEDGIIICPSCGEKSSKGMLFCPFCFSEFDESGNSGSQQEADYDEDVDPSLLIDKRYVITETFKDGASLSIKKVRDRGDAESAYSLRELQLPGDSDISQEEASARFDSAVSDILKISHQGAARVFDYFKNENGFYIVYDFIEGLTLTKFLRNFHEKTKKAIPEGMLVSIALKLCDIAESMHRLAKPMYCIDMRPSSIIISEDASSLVFINAGLPYVQNALGIYSDLDFNGGLFKSLCCRQRDLWCIGSVIYYLIAGLDLQMFESVEHSPITSIRRDLSPAFCAVLEKLLGRDRMSDYSSCDEFRKELCSKCRPRGIETYDFYYDMIGFDSSSSSWRSHMADQSRTGSIGSAPSIPMKVMWSFAAASKTSSFLAPFEDSIAAVFNDGRMFVLENQKGGFVWNCNVREKLNPIVSDGSRIFAASSFSPNVFCFAPGTENPSVWRTELDGMLMTAPLLSGGVLYQTTYSGGIYALDPNDGSVQWNESIDAMTIASPVIMDDTFITAGLNGIVYAFSLEKRRIIWQYSTGGNVSLPCVQSGDSVIVSDTAGNIFSIDCRTSSLNWKISADSPISSSVKALKNMLIFISRNGIMYNVSSSGEIVWRLKVGGQGEYQFCVTNNRAYVFVPDGRILVIDLFTGKLIDKNSVKMKLSSEPVIYRGRLFFAIQDGTIFCFG